VTRQRLVSLWGAERIEFDRVDGNLEEITPLSSKETIQVLLDRNPDLTRWKSELERQETAVALARSQAVPDITLNIGVRNFQETNDNALVAGIEIPLPLFDRNQGGVGEARANLLKARQEQRAAEVTVRAGLSETWQYLSAAYVETAVLRDEILPGALSAFEATKLGYSEGKLDFLQMLDAQRTLFTVKRQYLLALEAYHMAVTDVERLIALPLKNLLEATTRTIKGVHKDEN
jgi:cobalt-zinc-cadmium efflux system outer membrane protein